MRGADPKLDIGTFATGLNVWDRIDEWEDDGGRPPGSHHPVSADEAQGASRPPARRSTASHGRSSADYAADATYAFPPRERKDENNILLAEAGTGLGKTLGYLAPAWHLGAAATTRRCGSRPTPRTCSASSTRKPSASSPIPRSGARRIVIRKGRENYVCLLNMQEAFGADSAPAIRARRCWRR